MSRFAHRGLLLQELLQSVVVRWRTLRGLLLVDSTGLPLVSTLTSRSLEERLAALGSFGIEYLSRARDDLEIGEVHVLHLAAQDRQVFLVPVQSDAFLMAIAEADANPIDLERQLLATARDLLAIPEAD